MVFKILCIIVLWTKVESALEGLNFIVDIKSFMSIWVEILGKMNSLKKLILKILPCIPVRLSIIFLQILFI